MTEIFFMPDLERKTNSFQKKIWKCARVFWHTDYHEAREVTWLTKARDGIFQDFLSFLKLVARAYWFYTS